MDGVTVLREFVWRDMSILGVLPSTILMFVLMLLAFYGVYMMIKEREYIAAWLAGVGAILIAALVCFTLIAVVETLQATYTRYEIIVDDSVNFNELTSHYEIISNDGILYIVQERE